LIDAPGLNNGSRVGKRSFNRSLFHKRELWETSPVPVEDSANHICCLIDVQGLLTERDCRAAIQRVVDRQEVLRLSFLPGKERPLQMIRKTGKRTLFCAMSRRRRAERRSRN
jgi:hypothetical protein